jgi:hypothetical protein
MAITYGMYIQTFLKVDEDCKGLYVSVPGYADDTFKVYSEENDICPQVTHCRCSHFAHKGTCEHAQAVQVFWNRIYKSNIEKAEMKALETSMDASDLVEEVYEEVAFSEQIEATIGSDTLIVTKVQKIAASLNIAIEEVARIAKIAADYQQEIKPKHTEMTLPVGPGDTRKRKKIDHHSKVTASFFNGLPSRNPAA